ncbi:MAG: beta-ribofuranosylaminobenzene 5'-phosphate synthase family protein [Campylobacterota bacterium]|nr:beta-ribofuranosylaminobenzene 5'-phosphate synthase family protein [Campylobacterota bacterium]
MKIKIYPRIAINLIGMHNGLYRKNGGIGFSIKKPSIVLKSKRSKQFNLEDKRDIFLKEDEQKRILEILELEYKKNRFKYKITIKLKGLLPTHSGFGSSTAIRLASLESLYILNNYKYTRKELLKASRRGGTSGIGVNTYFDGGYVFDIGKKIDGVLHKPSSIEKVYQLPLKIDYNFMPNWDIGICIPKDIKSKSEQEEKKFFNLTCPIKASEAYEMLYHTVYGILSSIKENDIDTFCKALKNIQRSKWKKAERELYGNELLDIENILYKNAAKAVGMSSLGPMLFFIADDLSKVIKKSKKELNCILIRSKVNNKGRKVES